MDGIEGVNNMFFGNFGMDPDAKAQSLVGACEKSKQDSLHVELFRQRIEHLMIENQELTRKVSELQTVNDPNEYTEEQREKDKIAMEEHFGWKLPRMMGFQVLARICTREELHKFRDKDGNVIKNSEGKEVGIYIPTEIRKYDSYSSNVGLVCAMGPHACRSTKSQYYGPRYRIGDYVVFPPSAGLMFPYKGISFKTFLDENAICQVDNPEDVLIPLESVRK